MAHWHITTSEARRFNQFVASRCAWCWHISQKKVKSEHKAMYRRFRDMEYMLFWNNDDVLLQYNFVILFSTSLSLCGSKAALFKRILWKFKRYSSWDNNIPWVICTSKPDIFCCCFVGDCWWAKILFSQYCDISLVWRLF